MKNNIFTNNFFKIIAVITMIIDHFGYYFYPFMNSNVYLICRIIGRFAMPVFLYFIVYGYFKTKNYNNYLKRVFGLGVITQLAVYFISIINNRFVPTYDINICNELNVLFNFTILLIVMKLIDNFKSNKFFCIVGIISSIMLPMLFKFEYSYIILVLGLIYYFSFKFKISKFIYIPFLIIYIIIFTFNYNYLHIFMIIPVLLLTLHSGNIGKFNNKYLYYYIFPIQHILIYSFALIYEIIK